jgi:hypothetical protein
MALSRFLPSPPLSAYIEAFCFSDGEASLPPKKERCLPNGQVAVVVNLGHDTIRVANLSHADQFQHFHGSVFTGAFSRFCVLDTTTMVTTLSLCFKPGGARFFLPMPVAELANQVVDLSCILWRLRYKLSLRDVAEMFLARGFTFTHEAIRDWETRFAPLITEQLRAKRRGQAGKAWYIDETYLKVHGKRCYLYRAIDKDGNFVDSMLSEKRNMEAAQRFSSKPLMW